MSDWFLVRHAKALPAEAGQPDFERPLAEDGARRFRRVVRCLARAELRFERVYTSPLLRARQTAGLLDPLRAGDLLELEELARPPGPELLEAVSGQSVALVGHEPWLSALLGWLLTGQLDRGAAFPLKKGAVAWLQGEPRPGEMQLRALITPRLCS